MRILFLIFGLLGASYVQAYMVDKTAATVNNEVVLHSDIEHFQRTIGLRRELDPLFGFTADLEEGDKSKDKILEFLIQEKLIGQSFKISDPEIDQEITTVQRNTNLDKEQLIQFLKAKGFSYDDYYDLMRVGLQKRHLIEREIRSRVNISDDDIRNYFTNVIAKNEAIPLEYNIQIILINPTNYKTREAAMETAQSALRSVRQGEAFAEVAKRFSDDPSAQQGGELGFLKHDQLSKHFRETVPSLKIGQVTQVLETTGGFLIIKLVDARSTESTRYLEMKETIREQLAKEEYKRQLFLWAERSKNNAYVHISQ